MATVDEGRTDAELGHFWDGFGQGATPVRPSAGLDPALAETVRRLHALATAPSAAAARERVWRTLTESTWDGTTGAEQARGTAVSGLATTPNGRAPASGASLPPRPPEPIRRARRGAELATAAVVTLALLSGILALRLAPSGSEDEAPGIAGSIATPTTTTPAVPGPELCRVAPRSLQELAVLAGVPTPPPGGTPSANTSGLGISPPFAFPAGTVPAGFPVDPETIAGVQATFEEIMACQAAGDARRLFRLYSDDLLRSLFAGAGVTMLDDLQARIAPTTPAPAAAGLRDLPVFDEDLIQLPDGRVALGLDDPETSDGPATPAVGGFPPHDVYFVFVLGHTRWLLDEVFQVDPTAAPPAGGTAQGVPITLRDGDPDRGPETLTIHVHAGEESTFLVENRGGLPRQFIVPGLGIHVEILPGERRVVVIDGPIGEYPLSVPGGLAEVRGAVVVHGSGTPPPAP